jgi:hypothetical protein
VTCEKCQTSDATVHITERGPSGTFVGHYYCTACGGAIPYPDPRVLELERYRDQLTQALIEASALSGRHLSSEEASETVTAFLKLIERKPPSAAAD